MAGVGETMIEVFRLAPGEMRKLDKAYVTGASVKKERKMNNFSDVDYIVSFSNGEELKLRLTPPEPFPVTEEDYETYLLFQEKFGPGAQTLCRAGSVRLLRSRGVVVGFVKSNRWAVRVCV